MKPVSLGVLAGVVAFALSVPAAAQESGPKSGSLARQLATALEAAKSDSIAAKGSAADTYVSALYIPGFELLVVSGKYSAPQLLDARLEKKEYKDIYSELNSAVVAGTKVFIEDVGADGVKPERDDAGFDSVDIEGKQTTFDQNWRRQQNLSEDDYNKAFQTADERYASMLTALLAQFKK